MKIALTADPELPVPPLHYGGIERIVDMLARGLTERGHDVTLFANTDSHSVGDLVPWPGMSSRSMADTTRNAAALALEVVRRGFDIVHSFSRIAYLLPILPLPVPKLMTYQRAVSRRSVLLGHRLSRGTLEFSAISKFMTAGVGDIGLWHLVYNGVPIETYPFVEHAPADAPLAFLGRMEEIKGPHVAIEIARRAGARLVLAGNVPDAHRGWFEQNIEPHIDGERVCYVGPVDDAQKSELLGSARAFLMPILWEEPFGIVMAEAMSCGTPVIGFRRGSVPEVVDHGKTGFVVDSVEQMVEAVAHAGEISRIETRKEVERRFSNDAVVEGYLKTYRKMLTRAKKGDGARA